jgi:hypothetical protein
MVFSHHDITKISAQLGELFVTKFSAVRGTKNSAIPTPIVRKGRLSEQQNQCDY